MRVTLSAVHERIRVNASRKYSVFSSMMGNVGRVKDIPTTGTVSITMSAWSKVSQDSDKSSVLPIAVTSCSVGRSVVDLAESSPNR